MTQSEMKKLDKRIRTIIDPLGKGYPSVRKLIMEMAICKEDTESNIWKEFIGWKSSRYQI